MIVSFLDSDDKLAENVFERVVEFFDRHPDINMATVEIMLFGAMTKDHKINWRFRDKEVVNIQKDYTNPHYYIGGAFVRRTALQRLEFDETMQFWEDALAINQVILDEGQYGLVSGVYYYYRKRSDETSLVDVAWKSKERYTSFWNWIWEDYGLFQKVKTPDNSLCPVSCRLSYETFYGTETAAGY